MRTFDSVIENALQRWGFVRPPNATPNFPSQREYFANLTTGQALAIRADDSWSLAAILSGNPPGQVLASGKDLASLLDYFTRTTVIVIDSVTDISNQTAVDAAGHVVKLGSYTKLREIALADIEKDPGYGHFERSQAEVLLQKIGHILPGLRLQESSFKDIWHVVRDI